MKRTAFFSLNTQHGVVLVEAMVAILLFSVGVLAIAGLQASMVQNASSFQYRTEASYLAQQTVGQMWVAPVIDDFVFENRDAPQLPGGLITVTRPNVADANQYLVIVGWTAPGEEPAEALAQPCMMAVAHCFTTLATITPLNPPL